MQQPDPSPDGAQGADGPLLSSQASGQIHRTPEVAGNPLSHGHYPAAAHTCQLRGANLLYVCVGVAIRENVWVLLPEDVPHSAARDDLQAAPAHPHSEGDFCKTTTPRLSPPIPAPPVSRNQVLGSPPALRTPISLATPGLECSG